MVLGGIDDVRSKGIIFAGMVTADIIATVVVANDNTAPVAVAA